MDNRDENNEAANADNPVTPDDSVQSQGGSVMDIQPPKKQDDPEPTPENETSKDDQPVEATAPEVTETEPANDSTDDEEKKVSDEEAKSSEEVVAPAPEATEPVEEDDVHSGTSTEEAASQPVEQQAEEPSKTAEPTPLAIPTASAPPAKKKKPALVVVLAVVVTLALAAAAVLAYMNMNNEPVSAPATDNQTSESQQQEVTPDEVEKLTEEIDQSLEGLDDAQDFPEEELTDENLEL
jgi:hypothetical protein